MPALETAHAVYVAVQIAKTLTPDDNVVVCVSGRGDKDVETVGKELKRMGKDIDWDLSM